MIIVGLERQFRVDEGRIQRAEIRHQKSKSGRAEGRQNEKTVEQGRVIDSLPVPISYAVAPVTSIKPGSFFRHRICTLGAIKCL